MARLITAVLLLPVILSGCGSNFEWFPKGGAFNNNSTTTVPVTLPGTVVREIPFPVLPTGAVQAVSDLFYDRSSATFWLLAVINGNVSNAPDALVQITTSGDYVMRVDATAWPAAIVNGSTLAFDGSSFWITSAKSGVSEIYQIFSNGQYLNRKFTCPATSPVTGSSFCQGLAWDSASSSYWSAAADSATLANYQQSSAVVTSSITYSGLWSGNGVTDVAFDSASGEVFVVKGGVIRVRGSSGVGLGTIAFSLPGDGRGDWDGTNFWVVDNTAKKIKALFVR